MIFCPKIKSCTLTGDCSEGNIQVEPEFLILKSIFNLVSSFPLVLAAIINGKTWLVVDKCC